VSDSAGKVTPRSLLLSAAKVVGEMQHGKFPGGFLLIQTAIDVLETGRGLGDDASDLPHDDSLFSGVKNYAKIVGLPLPGDSDMAAKGVATLFDVAVPEDLRRRWCTTT